MEPLMKKFKPSPQLKPLPQEIWYVIASFCNIKSLYTLMNTSIVKSLNYKNLTNTCHERLHTYDLRKMYKEEFPKGTPLVCACQYGRFEDVKLLITWRNDVNGNNIMTLKEYVSRVGKVSDGYGGWEYTPLMAAAENEHFQIVKYLIEQCEADPNITNSRVRNALHYAAGHNRMNTNVIKFLLTHMSIDDINRKKPGAGGYTPLDLVYFDNNGSNRLEIITLLRSKGGKANKFDENGKYVGTGRGDLNNKRIIYL